MYAVTVLFTIAKGQADRFLPLIRANARQSLTGEPGCHRFDVCTDRSQPSEVFLYELYKDKAAFDTHLASAHFRAFDEVSAPMIVAKSVRIYDEVAS